MAESVSKTFKTALEIGGKVTTLAPAVAKANTLLRSIGSTAGKVNLQAKAMFSGFTKGLGAVTTGVRSLLS
jgi:hypothetical protein